MSADCYHFSLINEDEVHANLHHISLFLSDNAKHNLQDFIRRHWQARLKHIAVISRYIDTHTYLATGATGAQH
jgi:hypothetical protein